MIITRDNKLTQGVRLAIKQLAIAIENCDEGSTKSDLEQALRLCGDAWQVVKPRR